MTDAKTDAVSIDDAARAQAYFSMESDLLQIIDLVRIAVILMVNGESSLVGRILIELAPKVEVMHKNYQACSFDRPVITPEAGA